MTERVILISLLILSWVPVNGGFQLGVYLAPFLLFAFALVMGRVRLSLSAVVFSLLLILNICFAFISRSDRFLWLNLALAIFTHGSLLFVLLHWKAPEDSYRSFVHWIAYVSILESVIAVLQVYLETGSISFSSGGEGDAAVGTLLTNSHLFAAKMWLQAYVLLAASAFGFRSFVIIIGLVCAVIGAIYGSALFLSMLFICGLGFIAYLTPISLFPGHSPRAIKKLRLVGVCVLVSVAWLFTYTQPGNVTYIKQTIVRSYNAFRNSEDLELGKARAIQRSLEFMSREPSTLAFGTGPGHYSSRAAMILTGGYLTRHSDSVPISMSEPTETVIYPMWNPQVWSRSYRDGVMNQPFNSLQSLLVEFGLIGVLLIGMAYLGVLAGTLLRKPRGQAQSAIQFTLVGVLVLLPLLLMSDNWLEYPSFMLPITILLSIALSVPRSWTLRELPYNRGE